MPFLPLLCTNACAKPAITHPEKNVKPSPPEESNDQPIDLSMSSTKRTSTESSSSTKPETEAESNKYSANIHSNHQQSNRSKFGLVEKKQITQEIVRSFSPYAVLNLLAITPPKSAGARSKETSNLYRNIRTEEFALLSSGVHTPHRLPVNFRMNAESNSSQTQSRLEVVVPIQTDSSSVKSPQNSQGTDLFITAEEKAVCQVCSKTFNKHSQLRLHLNIHNFERPFRCDSCGVSFQKKGHLQKHCRSSSHLNKLNMNNTFGKATSDNPRPFKCVDCQIAFRIHGHLAKHLRSKIHIMKLEYLGKLPFGMYAEMERLEIPLGPNSPIDTTDCKKALESLRKLAQSFYDPSQITWKSDSNADNLEDQEDYETSSPSNDSVKESPKPSDKPPSNDNEVDKKAEATLSSPTGGVTSQSTSHNQPHNQSIPNAMRSSTCDICSRTFKSAKFLQVHLYSEHPEEAN